MSESKKRKVEAEHRTFNKEWTSKYFFTNVDEKAVCLICRESVAMLKNYNLKRHFETKHSSKYEKFSDEQKRKKANEMVVQLQQKNIFRKQFASKDDITKVSYVIAHKIAKNSKPLSEGEFIKECMIDSASILCPDKKNQFENVCLSRRTIVRRVENIAENMYLQFKEKVRTFEYYSLALDESCHVRDTAQLLIFIRGITKYFEVTEEMVSMQSLKGTTTGEDLLEAVNNCLLKLVVEWNKLVNVTTDGGPNMTGKNVGLLKRIQDQVRETNAEQNIVFSHCIIHQEVLCKSVLNLSHVVDTVVKVVNYIRARGLNHRQFITLLEDLESDHTDVLYHTNVRWLSLGKILKRVWELKEEIGLFLDMKQNAIDFPQLNDEKWLSDFAFAVDIMGHMNDLNSKLHGKGAFAHDLYSSVKAFMKKLLLLSRQITNKQFAHFATLQQIEVCDQNVQKYSLQLLDLHAEFSRRFHDFKLIENDLQLELIEMQCDPLLSEQMKTVTLPKFYASLNDCAFPKLKAHAQRMLVLFGSTYICEQTFSIMKLNKSKLRSAMTDDHLEQVLFIATTEATPDFNGLVSNHQRCHPSH
ncbi:general transcription factor II-I repeat domain-containing protein 2B-like [Homarus americanus]|uniref:general transcription factor II-I repeat domain-containing protein 2B-like n=1 Tax=Homarus americanus TaxID=6706 RepID=UPI001C43DBA2|nr:general transcription factor II-I repeat domain-containing protein 2B-like [Homarus americanus]